MAPLVARDETVKTVVVDSDGEELKEKRKKVISILIKGEHCRPIHL